MITYTAIDGFLKRPKIRRWIAVVMAGVFLMEVLWTFHLLDQSTNQTVQVLAIAEFWEREALKWRAIALQSGVNITSTSKCDAEKCVNICTGAPAMEQHP